MTLSLKTFCPFIHGIKKDEICSVFVRKAPQLIMIFLFVLLTVVSLNSIQTLKNATCRQNCLALSTLKGGGAGLVLDEYQISILSHSWRTNTPDRMSAYKDEYRVCFPVHEQSKSMLDVPCLDDLLEPMLQKRHGNKMTKNWGKSRQLYTQPFEVF
ncbi:hypothetical protein DPMN_109417 [Dreissena polymorpha]|uniref:Uncharacterized protein n=1 Tax=Dreissena polymorpha TaxID=45954 RepID=A0A9D4KA92_DREPO|nr:hypothetical protein DPMN_109417 [Dreissena polymorpha]